MTDLPDPQTDPIPEEATYRYPFLARLFGLDVLAQQIVDAFYQAVLDQADLREALATLRTADATIDAIEPAIETDQKKGK